MYRLLVPAAVAGALIASPALAQTVSESVSSSPGYVAPMIESPPAFNGGQTTGAPPVQPFARPNVGDPGFAPFPVIGSPRRG